MEIRVLEKSVGGSFRTTGVSVPVAQVVFDLCDGFRLVHCDFPTEEEEREFLAAQPYLPIIDRIEWFAHAGGSGRITLVDESDSRIEIYGSVRALAPALRQIADQFEARLAELPR